MIYEGPAFTIVRRGRDVQGRVWVQVRKRGGQETRIVIPDIFVSEDDVLDAAADFAASIPELPGYWAV